MKLSITKILLKTRVIFYSDYYIRKRMKAILKQALGFSRRKGFPFYDFVLHKGDIVEVIKLHTEKYSLWSCWCIRILYNNEKYWCVYDYNTTNLAPCPIILLEN